MLPSLSTRKVYLAVANEWWTHDILTESRSVPDYFITEISLVSTEIIPPSRMLTQIVLYN